MHHNGRTVRVTKPTALLRQLMLGASDYRHLRRLLEQTGRSVRMARGQVMRRATSDAVLREDYHRSLQPVVDDHRALLDAVAAGEHSRASALMRRHLLETARDVTLLLRAAGE